MSPAGKLTEGLFVGVVAFGAASKAESPIREERKNIKRLSLTEDLLDTQLLLFVHSINFFFFVTCNRDLFSRVM